MVNAQTWLNTNYPREERWKIWKLDLSNKNLTGDLDLKDFRNLEEVNISGNPQIGELLNTEERGIIVKMDAQRWIDKKYPRREERSEITILRIYRENLDSLLNLEDFVNLREIYCSYNGLTGLNLKKCSHLQKLDCSNNKLTELDLSNCQNITKVDFSNNLLVDFDFNSLNPETLTTLYIKKNKFSPRNLDCFARFNNLESLLINDNPFSGSLKPLESCLKLKELSIGATKINSGLEHLPVSLQKIWFWNLEEGNSITEELRNYKEWGGMYDNYYYDLSRWRRVNASRLEEQAWIEIPPRN